MSVYKDKNGKWKVYYRYTDWTGKKKQTTKRGFETKREAVAWEREQHHMSESLYHFERTQCPPSDTLPNHGKGNPVAYTGMTFSGFRPSDDACRYGYLIPSNMFAAVVLAQISPLLRRRR